MSKGAEMIAAERERQVTAEEWTPAHDSQHFNGELVDAAVCYALHDIDGWPWERRWYKPKDSISDLVKAGALIAAEIDRQLAEKKA